MANCDPRSITLQAYDDFAEANMEAVMSVIDENARWITHGHPEIDFFGDVRGHSKISELFMNIGKALEVHRNSPDFLLVDGSRVVARGMIDATARATGRNFKTAFVDIFDFREGKIVQYERFVDTQKMFAALNYK